MINQIFWVNSNVMHIQVNRNWGCKLMNIQKTLLVLCFSISCMSLAAKYFRQEVATVNKLAFTPKPPEWLMKPAKLINKTDKNWKYQQNVMTYGNWSEWDKSARFTVNPQSSDQSHISIYKMIYMLWMMKVNDNLFFLFCFVLFGLVWFVFTCTMLSQFISP